MPAGKKVVVIGGGASGLFCALLLGEAGHRVTVLESQDKFAGKLAVSGGGHANFTNIYVSASNYLCEAENGFVEKALAAFPPAAIMERLASWGLSWRLKGHGRLFLREKAQALVKALEMECGKAGVRLLPNHKVEKIIAESHVAIANSGEFAADALVLAQGSPAGGRLAGSGWEVSLASQIGHKRLPFSPALTPFVFSGETAARKNFSRLAGIGCEVQISAGGKSWRDGLLFTHCGLSGPAVLNASLYWRKGENVAVDFLPGQNFEKLLDEFPMREPFSTLRRFLPARLAEALLAGETAKSRNACLSRSQRQALGRRVNNFIFTDLLKAPMRQAEACLGGVSLRDINPETLESSLHSGVYFTGEGLAVTGELGGYNLHWAWASAAAVARAITASRVRS